MKKDEHLFYTAANGDRWSLVRDERTATITVKCQSDSSSGHQQPLTTLQNFLAGPYGPQHDALIQMIRTLLHEALDRQGT